MKAIMMVVAVLIAVPGGISAADFSDLRSATVPGIKAAADVAVAMPDVGKAEVPVVDSIVVETLALPTGSLDEGEKKLTEIRGNMEKAGIVYICGVVTPRFINESFLQAREWRVFIKYAAKKAVPATEARILETSVRIKNNGKEEAKLMLDKVRVNLEKAGLYYISGEIGGTGYTDDSFLLYFSYVRK